MNTLNVCSFEVVDIIQGVHITVSLDKNLHQSGIDALKRELNITEHKVYQLTTENMAFAKKYHIPYKATYFSLDEITEAENLIEEYQELIEIAEVLNLKWDYSVFDYAGLKEAIERRIVERKQQ